MNNCNSNYKNVKYYFGNSNLRPEIHDSTCELFSLYGSLRGGSRNLSVERSDQCYCRQTFRGEIINNGQGKCYPEKLCGDCDLNKSGLCSQSAEPSSIAGI
mgnify:CR=1|jgi:hypothetical protein